MSEYSHLTLFEVTRSNSALFRKLTQLRRSFNEYTTFCQEYANFVESKYKEILPQFNIKTVLVSCNELGCSLPKTNNADYSELIQSIDLKYHTPVRPKIAQSLRHKIKENATLNTFNAKLADLPDEQLFADTGTNGSLAEEYVGQAIIYAFENLIRNTPFEIFPRVKNEHQKVRNIYFGNNTCSITETTKGGESDILLFTPNGRTVGRLFDALASPDIGFIPMKRKT